MRTDPLKPIPVKPSKPRTLMLSPQTVELAKDLTPEQLDQALRIAAKLMVVKHKKKAAAGK